MENCLEDNRIRRNEAFRHEMKYICSYYEWKTIESKLKVCMSLDSHAKAGSYLIRSIYFDDEADRCLNESIEGVDSRHKWRIRAYDASDEMIVLEKKSKIHDLTDKKVERINKNIFGEIMNGSFLGPRKCGDLLDEFLTERIMRSLRPCVIVQYIRYPYVYSLGNVRVTFDANISSSDDYRKFFERKMSCRPVMNQGMHLMEVKWDGFMPDYIYQIASCNNMVRTAFSKYQICRKYKIGGSNTYVYQGCH